MSNFNVRIVGTANVTQMVGSFAALEAQVEALNAQLQKTAIVANGVNPTGFQKMQRQVQQSSKIWRAAAASTGMWETEQIKVRSATDEYTRSLERQKLSFRDLIKQQKVARSAYREQLALQNMVVRALPGRAGGKQLLDIAAPTAVSAELDTIANRIGFVREQVRSASTQMINWGKNTQWAGRQLMVGFTLPIAAFGAATGALFYQINQQLTRIQKVYNTTADSTSNDMQDMMRVNAELEEVSKQSLGTAMNAAKQYGAAANDTLDVQANLAATGLKGQELQTTTTEVVRIATLGEIEYQDALNASIAMQSVFSQSTQQLTESFNYMNAIENATSLQLKDFTAAIPIAAAPVKAFGGDIQELGVLLTAMRENGIEAVQGANALKASLQRLGRPSKQVREEFSAITGESIVDLVDSSSNLTEIFTKLNDVTADLSDSEKRDVFAGLFGSYQVTKMMALVNGMGKLEKGIGQVSEAARIAKQDTVAWADVAAQEIERMQQSTAMKFKATLETLKIELAEMGEPFLKMGTSILKAITMIIQAFNKMPDWVKYLIAGGAAFMALVGPIVMLTGLFANFTGNMLKFGVSLTGVLTRFEVLNKESAAARIAAGLAAEGFATEASQVQLLTVALEKLALAEREAAIAARNSRISDLTSGGLSRSAAISQVAQERRQYLVSGGSYDRAGSGVVSKKGVAQSAALANNAERTGKGWKVAGGAMAVAATSMVLMAGQGDGLVHDFAEMAFYAALIGPALASIPFKSMGVGLKAAAVKSGALVAGTKMSGMAVLRMVGTFARFAGPAGLLVSAIAGVAILHSHIDDVAESMEKVNNTGDKWGEIFGYTAHDPGQMIDPQTGEAVDSFTERIKKLQESAPEVGQAIKTAFDKAGGAAADAKDQTEALNIAIRQGLNVIHSGGSADQAREAARVSLMAGVQDATQVERLMREVDLRVKFKLNQSVMDASLTQVMDQINTAIDDSIEKNDSEKIWDFFSGGDGISEGSRQSGENAAQEFYRGFADPAISDVQRVAMARNIQSQFDAMEEAAISAVKGNSSAMDILSKYGMTGANSGNEISQTMFDMESGLMGGQGETDAETLKSMGIDFEKINQVLSSIGTRNAEFTQDVAKSLGFTEEMYSNWFGLEQLLQAFMPSLMSIQNAQNAYNASLASVAGRMAMAGKAFTKEQKLHLLNSFRVSAGLEKTGNILDGFGPATVEWTSKMNAAGNAADHVNSKLKLTRALIAAISDAEVTDMFKGAMQGFQQGIADATAEHYLGAADANLAAVEAAGKSRMESFDAAAESASNGLENRQEKRRKAMEHGFDMRIKKIQDEIDAEQKADKIRQRIYDNEQKRLDRLAAAKNAEIDFNMALNEGNLDEAARIRNEAEAQAAANAAQDENERQQQRSEHRQTRLQKQIDKIEKERTKALDKLSKLEERESAAQQRRQDAERTALQASVDANLAAEQEKYDARKEYIEASLEDFVNMVATSGKDLKKNIKTWEKEHKGLALVTEGRYQTTAKNINDYIVESVKAARDELVNSKMWEVGGASIAKKMIQGAFGLSMDDFKSWMVTGKYPKSDKGVGVKDWTNAQVAEYNESRHEGGWITGKGGSRKGIARTNPIHHTESLVRAKRGEFMVNEKAALKHRNLLESLNAGNDGLPSRHSARPMGGLGLAGLMYGGAAVASKAAIYNAIKMGSKTSGPKRSGMGVAAGGPVAGAPMGPGGMHRPINYPVTNGLHDTYTAYPAVDFGAPVGSSVYAVGNGVISQSYDIRGYEPRRTAYGKAQDGYRSYGRVMIEKLDSGPSVLFAHLSSRNFNAGTKVKGGTVIGKSGDTGNSTGPHLHFGASGASPYQFTQMKNGGYTLSDGLAMLHKRETVLTEPLTKDLHEGMRNFANGGNTTYNLNMQLQGRDFTLSQLAREVVRLIKIDENRKPQNRKAT